MRLSALLPALLAGLLVASASHGYGQSLSELQIRSPKAGAVVSGVVPIAVEAPEDLAITFLVFGVDDTRPVSTNARPFSCSWDTSTYLDGPHLLFVEAYSLGGLVAKAGPIRVLVQNHMPAVQAIEPPGFAAAGIPPVVVRNPAPRSQVVLPDEPASSAEPGVSLAGKLFDVPVRIEGDQALVPIRPLVERLDGSVYWDADARMATAWWRSRELQLAVGSFVAMMDGDPVRMRRAPAIRQQRMVLPARGCAQLLNLSVAWDALRRVIRMGFLPMDQPPVPAPRQSPT